MLRLRRFQWWVVLFFTSLILLLSVYFVLEDGSRGSWETHERWSIAFTAVANFLAICGMISVLRDDATYVMAECIIIVLQTTMWAAMTVAALVDNKYSIAVDPDNAFRVDNPNVYLFGFASFCMAILLTSSAVQQYVLQYEDSLTTTHWIFLASMGFLAMVSALAMRDKAPTDTSITEKDPICEGTDWTKCPSLTFGIVLGALSGSVSSAIVPCKNVPLNFQMEIAFLLLVAWACGIGILTVASGPAEQFNSLFLSTYASFLVCLSILDTIADPDQMDQDNVSTTPQVVEAPSSSDKPASMPAVHVGGGRQTDSIHRGDIFGVAYNRLATPNTNEQFSRRRSSWSIFESVGGWRGPITSSLGGIIPPSDLTGMSVSENPIIQKRKHTLNRLQVWVLLMTGSIVCLVTFRTFLSDGTDDYVDGADDIVNGWGKWAVAGPSISIAICCFGFVFSAQRTTWSYFAEGVLIVVSIPIWVTTLIAIFKTPTMQTQPANQFFSSWGAFYTSILLLTMWFAASETTTDWILLCTSSLVVFGRMVALRRNGGDGSEGSHESNCYVDEEYSCDRLDGAIVIGAISFVVSFVMACNTLVRPNQHLLIPHIAVATVMLIAWCVGACLIVYGDGPGQTVASIFFNTWLSLFLSLDLATTNICVYLKARQAVEKGDDPLNGDEKERHGLVLVGEDVETSLRNEGDNVLADLVKDGGSDLPVEMRDDPEVKYPATRQQELDGESSFRESKEDLHVEETCPE